MDKDGLDIVINRIKKQYGENAIFKAGEVDLSIERVPTGLKDLDDMILGFPKGRLVEVYGAYSGGKTSFAYHIMSKFPYSMFIDAEGTLDLEHAKKFGVKQENVIVRLPEWGEQAIETAFAAAEIGVPLIVIDSVPALVPRKEYEEEDFEKSGKVGGIAGLLSRKLPRLVHICADSGTSVIFINQVRANIGAGMFQDPYTTPGGYALKHFSSLRLQVTRKQWINSEKLGTFGQIVNLKVVKSKVSNPHGVCELTLLFDKGFIEPEDLAACRKDLSKNPPKKAVFKEEGE